MSHQELSSAKYYSENSTPDPEGASTESQVESSKLTRAAGINFIQMLLLFVVVAGINGSGFWLYKHIPRMKKGDSELRASVLSWFVGRDVTEPTEWQKEYDPEKFKNLKVEFKPVAIPRWTFQGNSLQMKFGEDDDDEHTFQDYDDWDEDY
jgi:hypothetical protein